MTNDEKSARIWKTGDAVDNSSNRTRQTRDFPPSSFVIRHSSFVIATACVRTPGAFVKPLVSHIMQTILGDVRVHFRYAVHFTTDLFAPGNLTFREVVAGERNERRPARVLFVVEKEVDDQRPVCAR